MIKLPSFHTTNRTEWNIMDIGILQTGAQNIPVYPTICAEDYEYVLNHSDSIYCFVSDKEVYDKVKKVQANTQMLKKYIHLMILKVVNIIQNCLNLGKDTSNNDELEALEKMRFYQQI